MKKITVLVAIMSCTYAAMAQKQSWYIGGNVGFSSSKQKTTLGGVSSNDGKVTAWSFSPEIGTFLTNNWQLGLGVTLSGSKNDPQQMNSTVTKSTNYGGTLYTRYFFGSGAFRPFVGANATVLPGTGSNTTGSVETKYTTLNWGINANAGFGYALSKKVTAVGSFGMLGFSQQVLKEKVTGDKQTTSTFGIDANSLGNRFTIGVYFTL